MNGESILRDEVRAWLGGRAQAPTTAEGLMDVVVEAVKAASPDEAGRMVEAMAGFLAALAEGNKKEHENVDGNRS